MVKNLIGLKFGKLTVIEQHGFTEKNKQAFIDWALSHGYSDNLTIDRIDVNGNYEPSNCRWIPMSEQYKNKQSNCNKTPLPEPYNAESEVEE